MSKRAERRHHKARMVARARELLERWGWPNYQIVCKRWADNLKKCSCTMCCNPRHGWESRKTFQELRHELELREESDLD